MKPRLIAFTLLCAASAAASAQSSVTLFGVVDVGVRYTDNGKDSVTTLSSNGLSTSRLGVRGIEDLGDGLTAGFWLEAGFNPDSGTSSDSNRFWDRRATVSLIHPRLGEIRLGRDNTPTYNEESAYDTFNANGVGSVDRYFPSSLSGAPSFDTSKRADNLASYFTPKNLAGFYGQLSAAPGEAVSGKRLYGGRLGYGAGPFDVSGAYQETQIFPSVNGTDKYQVWDVGGTWDFQIAKILGLYGETKFGNLKLDVWQIGTQIPIGVGQIRASYVHADASGGTTDSNDADQIAIGYVYNMSKRTALYTTYARISNKGNATFSVSTPPPAIAGNNNWGAELGLRHSF
jgi:predicted porin